MKRRSRSGFEQDVHTAWRRLYCYTQRAEVCRKAKRITNRRERHDARCEIAGQRGGQS